MPNARRRTETESFGEYSRGRRQKQSGRPKGRGKALRIGLKRPLGRSGLCRRRALVSHTAEGGRLLYFCKYGGRAGRPDRLFGRDFAKRTSESRDARLCQISVNTVAVQTPVVWRYGISRSANPVSLSVFLRPCCGDSSLPRVGG